MEQVPPEALDAIIEVLYVESLGQDASRRTSLQSMWALCLTRKSIRDVALPWLYQNFDATKHTVQDIKRFISTLTQHKPRVPLVRRLSIPPYSGDTKRSNDARPEHRKAAERVLEMQTLGARRSTGKVSRARLQHWLAADIAFLDIEHPYTTFWHPRQVVGGEP
jgi:hypothetical protein